MMSGSSSSFSFLKRMKVQQESRSYHSNLSFQRNSNDNTQSSHVSALQALNHFETIFQQAMLQLQSEMSKWEDHSEKDSTQSPQQPQKRKLSNDLCELLCSLACAPNTTFLALKNNPAACFGSSVGMRAHLLHRQAQYIVLKGLFQEWFDLSTLKNMFVVQKNDSRNLYKYPIYKLEEATLSRKDAESESSQPSQQPQQLYMDDTFFLCSVWDSLMSSSAIAPKVDGQEIFTRQNLIVNFYWLFTRLKFNPNSNKTLLEYTRKVLDGYEKTKKAYVSAVKREDVDYSTTVTYDVHENAFPFTRRTYTQDEFDWFEDLETDLPLHLGSCFKAIEIFTRMSSQPSENPFQMMKDMDECLKVNINNPYILYLKTSLCGLYLPLVREGPELFRIGNDSIHAALNIMKNHVNIHLTSASPSLDRLSKTRFDLSDEEQDMTDTEHADQNRSKEELHIPDLKFTPLLFLKATFQITAASVPSLSQMLRLQLAQTALRDLQQVERFSRMPNEYIFLCAKGQAYIFLQHYEKAFQSLSAIEKFENVVSSEAIIHAICSSASCMIALGHAQLCLEKIDHYIAKYDHHPALILLKLDCQRESCRSKDGLKTVLLSYQELANSLMNLANTNQATFSKYYLQVIELMKHVQKSIEDPSIPDSW